MKIFLDSADVEEIEEAESLGILDGVTTNPSLIKAAVEKYGKGKRLDMESYIKKILKVMKGKPVSLEVVGNTYGEMVKEGELIYKKFKGSGNVVVKIPIDPAVTKKNDLAGIRVIKELSKKKIPVNCTLIFTPEQALMAAKAGARYVSPFAGREDDYLRDKNKVKYNKKDYFSLEGMLESGKMVEDNGISSGVDLTLKCVQILEKNKGKCEVIAASIRNTRQLREMALVGADIATVSLEILKETVKHVKTKEGMERFMEDTVREYAELLGYKK